MGVAVGLPGMDWISQFLVFLYFFMYIRVGAVEVQGQQGQVGQSGLEDIVIAARPSRFSFGLGKRSSYSEKQEQDVENMLSMITENWAAPTNDGDDNEENDVDNVKSTSQEIWNKRPNGFTNRDILPQNPNYGFDHLARYHDFAKRGNFGFGLGKRNNFGFGLGKRNNFGFGLGKRANFGFGLGK